MNDEIDNKIIHIFKEDIELPYKYKYMIRNCLNRSGNKTKVMKNKTIKIIATGCACILITSASVFAKDISKFIKNIFNTSEGINTAIENGYIIEPNMEYIESNGTEAKIENLLMDDYNLCFTIKIKFQDDIDIQKIKKINLPDMIITDEQNKILYCGNEDAFGEYIKNNNLDYKYLEFDENYINSGNNWYIGNKENNEIEIVYNLYANKYPKSKKIQISYSKIDFSEDESANDYEKEIKGNWNLNLEIPEKFYNRESIIYTVKSCNDSTINVEEVSVNNTGTRFSFNTKTKSVYNEEDSKDIKNEKTEKFLNSFFEPERIDVKTVDNEYIELNNGVKYFPTEANFEDSKTTYDANGLINHFQTFNLTNKDCKDNMTIKFTLNTIYESKLIVIELERKK